MLRTGKAYKSCKAGRLDAQSQLQVYCINLVDCTTLVPDRILPKMQVGLHSARCTSVGVCVRWWTCKSDHCGMLLYQQPLGDCSLA